MELSVSDSRSVFDILRQRNGMPDAMGIFELLEMPPSSTSRLSAAMRLHWPEYLMEAAELGLFMVCACAFTVLLFHPSSSVAQHINNDLFRRFLMGLAMGSTAIAIIFSPIGKRSGAHFNPAVTLTFLRLRKVDSWMRGFMCWPSSLAAFAVFCWHRSYFAACYRISLLPMRLRCRVCPAHSQHFLPRS